MKTFIVKGQHWTKEVEIDDTIFEKYGDMAFEAMTQSVESLFKGEIDETYEGDVGLGWVMTAYEEGFEDDSEKTIASLTEHVLRNAGHHAFADEAKRMRKKFQNGEEI